MRTIFRAIIFCFAVFAFASCDSTTVGTKVASIGAPYEVLVICNQEKWDSALGDTLRSIMLEPVEIMNQREPLFDVLRILPNAFSGLLQKNRNVLNIITSNDYVRPAMQVQYDVYASPQLIVTISGPDNASVTEYMSEYRSELQAIFEIAERDRSLALNKRFGESKIEEQIFKMFGFNMNITRGYKVRNTEKDFMWVSFEYPTASQGVIIYSYPYTDKENFTIDSLLERRNQFTSLIPGETPGSHMTTSEYFVPDLRHLRINGRYWAEMRGFWDVKGDFMGGPFVSYSTLDTETRRVVTLDFYVFSPDKPKRNFMRGLEHLIYSVSFPYDEQVAAQAE